MKQLIKQRMSSLWFLAKPLALTFIGLVLLSLGVAYFIIHLYRTAHLPDVFWYLTLQFLPRLWRAELLFIAGVATLGYGLWQLSGMVVLPRTAPGSKHSELVLGYRRANGPPRVAVLSGGAGILVLASFGREAEQLTCVTPVQDPVEYYYRAASLFQFENVIYLPPTMTTSDVFVRLDDGSRWNIKQNISHVDGLARHHAVGLELDLPVDAQGNQLTVPVFRQALDALREADLIILGPGSLFESVLPNLLIPEIREAIRESHARTVYICNLMTEPALTTGFSVADHIRQFRQFADLSPDFTLVNAQRIEAETRRMYEAANQMPVYLSPEEYEETVVSATDRVAARDVVVEGSVVIEADLASSVVQLTASLDHPGESRTVRVLRHDPEKLTAALKGILERA